MNDFAEYIDHLGVDAAEARVLSSDCSSWQDLRRLMEAYPTPTIQPNLRRTTILPSRLNLSIKDCLRRWTSRNKHKESKGAAAEGRGWERLVESRRRGALMLTLATTAALVFFSAKTLQAEGMPDAALQAYLVIYGVMTFFLASNSYKLILGRWHASRGAASNPWHPSWQKTDPAPGVKVAIVYPVLHENVARVAAGMAATWQSIARENPELAECFDLFLLSDSRDLAHWIAEETAVHELRRELPEGRFYYRRRSRNVHAKLGNLMDFCRRWGGRYKYMLMMDADSLMDGKACIDLLRMMEANDRIGILQTNPRPVLRRNLFGRMQQFAGRLYGSVFSYSLQSMFMGHACYIGHNAIIRMDAFMQHCILPLLSGPPPWGGKPLSHDIIESALMARAGYEVWFLPEIEGTYEETPGNILDFLVRERRWMQGNLQHLRFILLDGLQSIHRETFFNGSMGYLSAPLWAVFLVISGYGMVHFVQSASMTRDTFGAIELPVTMMGVSAFVFLFLPRIMAFTSNLRSDRARRFGGKDKLAWSILFETAFSFCFSALIMINITRFMWLWLRRRSISWNHAVRDDEEVPWSACFQHFAWVSAVGAICWLALQLELLTVSSSRIMLLETLSDGWLSPGGLVIGYLPVLGGFAASMLIVRVTSKTFPVMLRCRLFCIPEEIDVPPVIQDMERWQEELRSRLPDPEDAATALEFGLGSPFFYVGHRPDTRARSRVAAALLPKIRSRARLTEKELLLAFGERSCFDALHESSAQIRVRHEPVVSTGWA